MSQLEEVDRELAAFEKTEEVLRSVQERALALGRDLKGGSLSDVDRQLAALTANGHTRPLDSRAHESRPVETKAPPGVSARPVSWDEARAANADQDVGSGLLVVDDSPVPPVLAPVVDQRAIDTAAYIDPPTSPPPRNPASRSDPHSEARSSDLSQPPPAPLALDPDPELGELSPEVPVVRPPTQPPPARRPSALPAPNSDAMLAEELDRPASEPPPPPPPPLPPPVPSVAEDEARHAVAALMANDAHFPPLGSDQEDDLDAGAERTVMVHSSSIQPPADEPDGEADFEIDIDDDVVVLDETDDAAELEAAERAKRSRPPPPPSRPPDVPKSRPPPPGKGFLTRILKGNKPD